MTVDRPLESRTGFDPALSDKRAECDGGGAQLGGEVGYRAEFAGTLTGEYFEQGDPPWRFYLLAQLTQKPAGYEWDSVWCESGFLYVKD